MLKKVLKQKAQAIKCRYENSKPQLLQSIHQQFYMRMHNLDYLQWLEQNGMRYTAGICVMALLLSTAVLWKNHDEMTEKAIQPASRFTSYEEAIGYEEIVESNLISAQQSVDTVTEVEGQTDVRKNIEPNQTETGKGESHETAMTFMNPLHLSGYQAPCSGMLLYNYGLGYDAVYEDYRYHRELSYEKGNGTIYACVNGTVSFVDMAQQWQVAIQSAQGTIWYAGLSTCDSSVGTIVKAGTQIGTTNGNVYIRAVREK